MARWTDVGEVPGVLGGGEAYIDMGIAWCSEIGRHWFSRIRVSSGEKMYAGGDVARAHVDNAAMWFLDISLGFDRESEAYWVT